MNSNKVKAIIISNYNLVYKHNFEIKIYWRVNWLCGESKSDCNALYSKNPWNTNQSNT